MSIRIEYTFDKATYLTAGYHNYRLQFNTRLGKILGVLFLIFYTIFVLITVCRGLTSLIHLLAGILILTMLLRWPLYKWQLSRAFSKYAEKDVKVSWEISQEHLKSKAEGKSEGLIHWSAINKAVKLRDGYLLYRLPVFYWFPNSAFASDQDRAEFEALVKANVKDYKNR